MSLRRGLRKAGFTLIELLIVVVIIGLLAAIAIPRLVAMKEKAFDSAALNDLRNVMTAQEAYFADHQRFARLLSSLQLTTSEGVSLSGRGLRRRHWAIASHSGSSKSWNVCVGYGGTQDGKIKDIWYGC